MADRAGSPGTHPDPLPNCPRCLGTGYSGRQVIAEWLDPSEPIIAKGILEKHDSHSLHSAAVESGHLDLADAASRAVQAGWTTPEEVIRVLGLPAT